MKRLYLVEKMRDSHTVGLVIGSASLEKCNEAISRIRNLCKKANKKIYVFFIGKVKFHPTLI
jgi:diphthamide biosynthesis protein 2